MDQKNSASPSGKTTPTREHNPSSTLACQPTSLLEPPPCKVRQPPHSWCTVDPGYIKPRHVEPFHIQHSPNHPVEILCARKYFMHLIIDTSNHFAVSWESNISGIECTCYGALHHTCHPLLPSTNSAKVPPRTHASNHPEAELHCSLTGQLHSHFTSAKFFLNGQYVPPNQLEHMWPPRETPG